MQVKAQGLLNAGKYVESRFGAARLASILAAVSPGTRVTYESAIAINWHPLEELCEFVEEAERQAGDGTGKLTEEIGAAGAKANLKGVLLRVALYLAKPSFLMERIAGMWRQFNDEGSLVLLEMTPERASLELKGLKRPNATLCRVFSGWIGEVSRSLGAQDITVHHSQCRARGAMRCVWEVRGFIKI